MTRKLTIWILCSMASLAFCKPAFAAIADTSVSVPKLVNDLKKLKNMSYSYEMKAVFPNGDKDGIKGHISLSNDDMVYCNDNDAFLMFYDTHWFYKADHRKKQLTILDMDRQYDHKLKIATDAAILKNSAVTNFLDATILKTATIEDQHSLNDTLYVSLGFPARSQVKTIEIKYDKRSGLPIAYRMVVHYAVRKTPKSIQSAEATVVCSDFHAILHGVGCNPDDLFVWKNGKFELKKFKEYTLSTKM